jgi:hypothetical protein
VLPGPAARWPGAALAVLLSYSTCSPCGGLPNKISGFKITTELLLSVYPYETKTRNAIDVALQD